MKPFDETPAANVVAMDPTAMPSELARANRVPLVALLGLWLALLVVYRDTFMAMAGIWHRSDTFAHGYVIAPIAAWLVWRRRDVIACLELSPSWTGALLLVFTGMLWLLGELVNVAAAAQFGFVGLLIAAVPAMLGWQVARAFAFPLGFLFFMVPFGEFLFPTMMDWTTEFVVGAVRLFGVPVHAEGRSLVIPSGNWQIVEGCSGVRYLIASIVVGTLYAYLNYQSTVRRLIFVAASVVVPVLANWVRAWAIVMLGHVSDNRIATGVDHLVYGWVFFGIVIFLLFFVGTRWQEDERPDALAAADASAASGAPASVWRGGAVVPIALAAGLAWPGFLAGLDAKASGALDSLPAPQAAGAWRPLAVSGLPDWSPSFSGMRATARSAWSDGQSEVGLYVGYYHSQQDGEELVSSENRVLISKDPTWQMSSYGRETLNPEPGVPASVRSLDMRTRRGEEQHVLIWHWYWVDGRWVDNDIEAKLRTAWSRLRGRGDDSAVVMAYTPHRIGGDVDVARAGLARFTAAIGPNIGRLLARSARSRTGRGGES